MHLHQCVKTVVAHVSSSLTGAMLAGATDPS